MWTAEQRGTLERPTRRRAARRSCAPCWPVREGFSRIPSPAAVQSAPRLPTQTLEPHATPGGLANPRAVRLVRAPCWPVQEGTCPIRIRALVPSAPRLLTPAWRETLAAKHRPRPARAWASVPASQPAVARRSRNLAGAHSLNAIHPRHVCAAAAGSSAALRRQLPLAPGQRLAFQLSVQPSAARPSMGCARGLPPHVSPSALPR